jgi:hypothetical protein
MGVVIVMVVGFTATYAISAYHLTSDHAGNCLMKQAKCSGLIYDVHF